MRLILILAIFAAMVFGQAAPVRLSETPTDQGVQTLTYPDGSNNLVYICKALSNQGSPGSSRNPNVTVTTISNAGTAVVTATAHGFSFETVATANPIIKITGATAGWAGLNGVWIATITSANAFTIALDTSGFGTFTGQSITVTTLAPRINLPQWSIKKLVYDASNNLLFQGYAAIAGGAGSTNLTAGSPGLDKACSLRANYGYQ